MTKNCPGERQEQRSQLHQERGPRVAEDGFLGVTHSPAHFLLWFGFLLNRDENLVQIVHLGTGLRNHYEGVGQVGQGKEEIQ